MIDERNLKLRGEEVDKYNLIKDRGVTLTRVIGLALLHRTGMDIELNHIFHEVGWENFCTINEPGCELLTLEFLCILKLFWDGIKFTLFNKEFNLTWKQLSLHWGFKEECIIDVDIVIPKFVRPNFWKEISNEDKCDHPHTNSIQVLVLRFMHIWQALPFPM
jgi:hypothetical protein